MHEQYREGCATPALQVRDFPSAIYEELKASAAANHRSVAQYTIIAVEEMLTSSPLSEGEGPAHCQAGKCPLGFRDGTWGITSFPGTADHDSAARTVRIGRRKQLFKEFDEISWIGSDSSTEDIMVMVREERGYLSERAWRMLAPMDILAKDVLRVDAVFGI